MGHNVCRIAAVNSWHRLFETTHTVQFIIFRCNATSKFIFDKTRSNDTEEWPFSELNCFPHSLACRGSHQLRNSLQSWIKFDYKNQHWKPPVAPAHHLADLRRWEWSAALNNCLDWMMEVQIQIKKYVLLSQSDIFNSLNIWMMFRPITLPGT